MGQLYTKAATDSTVSSAALLKPAMEGDINEIKRLVKKHVAEQDTDRYANDNEESLESVNPVITEFINGAADAQGNTALHASVFGGHSDLVKFLHATCNANLVQKNELGCSPLWLAAGYNHEDILVYLIEQLSSNEDHDECTLEKSITDANSTGDTPIIAAASRGNIDICRILLKTASSNLGESLTLDMIRVKNNGGDTALAVAVGSGHKAILDLFLEWDLKIVPQTLSTLNQKNKLGLTPLLVACERGDAEIVSRLVQAGAQFLPDDKGASPLSVVAFCGHKDVAEKLLELSNGDDILNQRDATSGNTPLWHAARTGNVSMVEFLLEKGADPSIENNDGLTPKDVAIKYKKDAVLASFLDSQNRTTEDGTS